MREVVPVVDRGRDAPVSIGMPDVGSRSDGSLALFLTVASDGWNDLHRASRRPVASVISLSAMSSPRLR